MRKKIFFAMCVVLFGFISSAFAQDKGIFRTTPVKNHGEKWRIGYYEGGPYPEFQQTLIAIVKGLMKLGWIDGSAIPPQPREQTRELWHWLSTQAGSNYLEFVDDAYYSAEWDYETLIPTTTTALVNRLKAKRDLDLMIAMGTDAGKALANNVHETPVVIGASTDPVYSGIVASVDDSGYDHIHARLAPGRSDQHIRLFHRIVAFKRLGLVYADTPEQRVYASVNTLSQIAPELGYELVECHLSPDYVSHAVDLERCLGAFEGAVDALYLPGIKIVSDKLSRIVQWANRNQVATFSANGDDDVKHGVLTSISVAKYKYVGQFQAETIAKILNGASPRELEQVFEDPPNVVFNLKTAELLDFDIPVELLEEAYQIYLEIENTNE